MTVYYPTKKPTSFEGEIGFTIEGKEYIIPPDDVPCEHVWSGKLESDNPSTDVSIAYNGEMIRDLVIEDWQNEPMKNREFSLVVEIDSEFLVKPVLNLAVSSNGADESDEHHFFLERIRIPDFGPAQPPSGGGLFERGLATKGTVNPDSVRYAVQCEKCREGFTFCAHHSGLLEFEYLYCDKSSQPVCIPVDDKLLKFRRPEYGSKPEEFSPSDIAEVRRQITSLEEILPGSDYDGNFRWLAPFRCPHCGHPFIDFRNNLFRKAWEIYMCCHKGAVMRNFTHEMSKKSKKKDEAENGNEGNGIEGC